jgi:hypothetical protein
MERWKVLSRAILTFGYSNHKGALPLTATLAFGMGTFGKRTASLRDFDHQSVEMLAFRRAMATDTWFTAFRLSNTGGHLNLELESQALP